jgi:hypothetical protein
MDQLRAVELKRVDEIWVRIRTVTPIDLWILKSR